MPSKIRPPSPPRREKKKKNKIVLPVRRSNDGHTKRREWARNSCERRGRSLTSPRSVKKDEKKREGDRVQKLFPGTLVGGL